MKKFQRVLTPRKIFKLLVTDQLFSSGTNLKVIKRRLPAPASAAKTRPKSVGMVFDAKTIDKNPTVLMVILRTFSTRSIRIAIDVMEED